MIETSPRGQLPLLPGYLDGNTALWEPQQLTYLDGNTHWIDSITPNVIVPEVSCINSSVKIEAFNFIDTGQLIVSSNNEDFSISGSKIYYKGTEIDLSLDHQYLADDLIILKANTPGYFVWTKPDSFGDFKLNDGNLSQHPELSGNDFTFIDLWPKNRDYSLISQTKIPYISKSNRPSSKVLKTSYRPLYYLNLDISSVERALWQDSIIFREIKTTWPYISANGNFTTIFEEFELGKAFILWEDNFYWCNLKFKQKVKTLVNGHIVYTGECVYSIKSKSITKASRVMSWGLKILKVKNFNKLSEESV